jgi:glycosyltransferase involved in cell wall biosynthesis
MLSTQPFISVVIATRNRGHSVVNTVDSILKNGILKSGVAKESFQHFEILVVDQSTGDDCQQFMRKYDGEPRVFYRRTCTVGMARARNMAIAAAKGDIVAITDDDCLVAENWLWEIQAIFLKYPDVAILFGNVWAGEHDSSAGFIPSYRRDQAKIVSDVLGKNDVDGLGACMALRKQIWSEFYGFDEMLGVGGALQSSSEGDLVIRVLQQRHPVCETPTVWVTHNGFRTWEAGSRLIFRYWYGTGAMYGKHLKRYPLSTGLILILLAWRWAFGQSRVANSVGPNRQKIYRLYAFVSGLLKGLSIGIDAKTGHFRAASAVTDGS